MKAIQLVMPSSGDMRLVSQDKDGGTITLQPVYFGGECAGPIINIVDVDGDKTTVTEMYRLKIKDDGKIQILKGQV